jgi:hypothetical protein
MGLLGATLLAVLSYSLETRRLVRLQRDATEVSEHPWLHVAGWPAESALGPDEKNPFGATVADLPIGNAGRTPALIREITVQCERLPASTEYQVFPGGDANPRALAPGQRFVTRLVEVRFGAQVPPRLNVNAHITYRTIHGGSGRVTLRFRFADGVWKSRDTDYECTLLSGQRLPGVQEAETRRV